MPVIIRRATADDAPELTRLRAVMLESMGIGVGPADAPWRMASTGWFRERLTSGAFFAAFVAADPENGVVAAAAGTCDEHAPSPWTVTGLRGYVFNVVADPGWRGNGHASACLDALLTWFREETPTGIVSLHSSAEGSDLYLRRDFTPPTYPELVLRLT